MVTVQNNEDETMSSKNDCDSVEVQLEKLSNALAGHIQNRSTEDILRDVSNIQETLMTLFTLLFDVSDQGLVKVAKICGISIVQLLSIDCAFSSEEYVNISNTGEC